MILKSIKRIQKTIHEAKQNGATIGFVPTMGYLHDGHMSLIRRARKECDIVVVSIFVNPIQFGPQEDFEAYPRDLKNDAKAAYAAGVDYIFTPCAKDMYPNGFSSFVEVKGLTDVMCGASRPGHFRGVTTVVAKLFHCVMPDRAYFGQKDFQQFAVLKKMVADLNMPIAMTMCAIVREPDGLAMSSRNVYLTAEERMRALSISQSLSSARKMIRRGERKAQSVKLLIMNMLQKYVDSIDYVELSDFCSLESVKTLKGKIVIAVAVKVGTTRLIDNCVVRV